MLLSPYHSLSWLKLAVFQNFQSNYTTLLPHLIIGGGVVYSYFMTMGRYCNCHSDRLSLACVKTTLKQFLVSLWLLSSGLLFGHFLCHTMRWAPGSPLVKFPASTG